MDHKSPSEIASLAALITGLLICAGLLGPVGLALSLGVFGVTLSLRLPFVGALSCIVIGLGYQIFFANMSAYAFWQAHLYLAADLLAENSSLSAWFWAYPITLGTVCWGLILGGTAALITDIWTLAPAHRVFRDVRIAKKTPKVPLLSTYHIKRVNAQPAGQGQGSTIGVILNSGRALHIPDTTLNTHILITGTTGSGKSVACLNFVESFIDRGLPVIFLDGKGELSLAQRVLTYAQRKQRRAWLFSMVGKSCHYNPLAHGSPTANKDKLIDLRDWSEVHYRKLAEGYLQLALNILNQTQTKVTLLDLAEFLSQDKLIYLIRQAVSNKLIPRDLGEQLLCKIEDQEAAAKQITGLTAELRNLAESDLRPLFECTNNSDIMSLKQVIAQNGVAYIALMPLRYPVFADVLGKLILNDLKSVLDAEQPKKLLLVIDEFSTVAGTQVLNLLNQGRSLGLHIILTIQSIGDLGQKIQTNPNLFIRQVLANCNLFWVHRMNASEDAELLAQTLGTEAGLLYTAQVDHLGATGLSSARPERTFKAHPDSIKYLPTGQGFFLDKNTVGLGVRHVIGRKGPLAG